MLFSIRCDPRDLKEVTECVEATRRAGHSSAGFVYGDPPHRVTLSVYVRRTKVGYAARAYSNRPEDQ